MVDKEVLSALRRSGFITPEHLNLIDAILTLPETSVEKEYQRRITAINAVAEYCGVEEVNLFIETSLNRKQKVTHPWGLKSKSQTWFYRRRR